MATCLDCGRPIEYRSKRCSSCHKAFRVREAKGWKTSKTGRVWVRAEGHPRAVKKYVLRAIIVLEAKLGRYLDWPREIAHHINGIEDDDRPENLEVVLRSEHSSYGGHAWWEQWGKHHLPNTPGKEVVQC